MKDFLLATGHNPLEIEQSNKTKEKLLSVWSSYSNKEKKKPGANHDRIVGRRAMTPAEKWLRRLPGWG